MGKLLIIIIGLLLFGTLVTALIITPLGNGRYLLNFSDGTIATASNIDYNRKDNILTMDLNVSTGRGLSISNIVEAKQYAEDLKGVGNHFSKATLIIR